MDQNNQSRALIVQSEMTLERAIDLINANHARTPLTPDQIYVFRMVLSGQAIDSHQTRMGMSTLNNYAVDFATGRGLMNSHRTGGWDASAELPIGRTFATDINGDFLPEDADYDALVGATLGVYSYIQRGLKLTDVSTDDAIRGIDGGTINDVSVGFTMSPNGLYRCSICGGDMADWYGDCTHVPGATYDEGRAFAWVDNAHGREASLVYKGSNPQAVIDKAIRMVETGQLSHRDALMLEEQFGARILSDRTLAIAKPIEKSERKGVTTVDWDKFLAELKAVDGPLAERVTGLAEEDRPGALLGAMRDLNARIGALTPKAVLGDKWLEDLIDGAVKMRVRAESDKFDGEKYRKFLQTVSDPDFIKAETESWGRMVKGVLGDGSRPTGGAQQEKVGRKVPSGAYK